MSALTAVERVIFWCAVFGIFIGCAAQGLKSYQTPDPKGNETIAKIALRGEDAGNHVELAKPHADKIGNVHLEAATVDLKLQQGDIKTAKTELQTERTSYQKIIDGQQIAYHSLEEYYGTWYRKLAIQIVNSILYICYFFAFLIIVSLVLRILSTSFFKASDFGAVIAGAATLICGLIPWVGHWIQVLFDNIFFRQQLKTVATTTVATAEIKEGGEAKATVTTPNVVTPMPAPEPVVVVTPTPTPSNPEPQPTEFTATFAGTGGN